jgi:putative DNA primase/helicase
MTKGGGTGPAEPASMTVLGYEHDKIVVYDTHRKIILYFKDGDLKPGALVAFGLAWLQETFPGRGAGGFDALVAADFLRRLATSRGPFDRSQVRGRGVCKVNNELVYHAGDRIFTGGVARPLPEGAGGIYLQAPALPVPADTTASSAEGAAILKLADGFGWEDQTSGILLAGWCALAPFSGALGWRPHIWITGGAGSGKSTVLRDFVLPLTNGSGLFVQGNTSEAGIRQFLKQDALPIIMDEAEQSDDGERKRMGDLVTLLRQSSSETGARTLRGTAGGNPMDFCVRSMACLASIQVGLRGQADIERFALLELVDGAHRPQQLQQAWQKQVLGLTRLREQNIGAKLHRRMMDQFPAFEKSLPAFRRACLEEFGSPRFVDQYAPLIAAAWVMANDGVAGDWVAENFMRRADWSARRPQAENDDPQQAWGMLLAALIRVEHRNLSVFDLIRLVVRANLNRDYGQDAKEAERLLRSHGLIVRLEPEAVLMIGRKTPVDTLLKDTPYRGDPAKLLARLPGAKPWPTTQTFSGVARRVTAVPLAKIEGLYDPEP